MLMNENQNEKKQICLLSTHRKIQYCRGRWNKAKKSFQDSVSIYTDHMRRNLKSRVGEDLTVQQQMM